MEINQSEDDLTEDQPIRALERHFSTHIQIIITATPKKYLLRCYQCNPISAMQFYSTFGTLLINHPVVEICTSMLKGTFLVLRENMFIILQISNDKC